MGPVGARGRKAWRKSSWGFPFFEPSAKAEVHTAFLQHCDIFAELEYEDMEELADVMLYRCLAAFRLVAHTSKKALKSDTLFPHSSANYQGARVAIVPIENLSHADLPNPENARIQPSNTGAWVLFGLRLLLSV